MPHCIIEYAKPLKHIISIPALLEATHQALIDSLLFEPQSVKTRAHEVEYSRVGEDEQSTFIHLHVAIMPGRTDAQKGLLLERVCEAISLITHSVSSISMEVVDIKQQHYAKMLN